MDLDSLNHSLDALSLKYRWVSVLLFAILPIVFTIAMVAVGFWQQAIGDRIEAVNDDIASEKDREAKAEQEALRKQLEASEGAAKVAAAKAASALDRTLPRTMGVASAERLPELLAAIDPRPDMVSIMYAEGDTECRMLAADLQILVENAGWKTQLESHRFISHLCDFGIGTSFMDNAPAYVQQTADAFTESGFVTQSFANETLPETLCILVYEKSPIPQEERRQAWAAGEQDRAELTELYKKRRKLTDEQISSLESVVRGIGPQTLRIAAADNQEALDLAVQVGDVLFKDQWKLIPDAYKAAAQGIVLQTHCHECMPAWVESLNSNIIATGLDCRIAVARDLPEGTPRIFFGMRPDPQLPRGRWKAPPDKLIINSSPDSTFIDIAQQFTDGIHKHLSKPRRLTGPQVESLEELLREIGPHSVSIAAIQEDEPVAFAKQLTTAFKAAGWTVSGHDVIPPSVDGISLLGRDDSSVPSWGPRLYQVFRVEMNFACAVGYADAIPKDSVGIFISKNPLAMIPRPIVGADPPDAEKKQ